MRIGPTSVEYANLGVSFPGVSGNAITNLVLDVAGPIGNVLAATSSSLTQFRPYHLMNNNNAAGYLGLSAEL